jgi:acyl carrier protein
VKLQPGTWLIFADADGIAEYIARALRNRGQRCVLIWPGDHYQQLSADSYQIVPAQSEDMKRLLREIYNHDSPPCRGILHLWSLQSSIADVPTVDQLLQGQRIGTESILVLVQAIAQQGWRDQLRLWLFTRLAQNLPREPSRVIAAPQWGLLRTIMHEYPALQASGIDIPDHLSPSLLETLVILCTSQTTEDQFLLREDGSFVARMQPLTLPLNRSFEQGVGMPCVRSDGTYVLAGGSGGIGLILTRWLVEQGAGCLVLLSRSQPSEPAAVQIEQLRQSGTSLHILQTDIADVEQLTQAFSSIRASMPPIRGIFHSAGILDDATLLNLDDQRWQRVLRPKMLGAWLLHTLTAQDPLDYFVLFSSAASLLGSAGQGNYAAANAFVDALAHLRCAQGQPALSINWGPWATVGLAAAQENRGQRLATRGIGNILPEQGVAVLDCLLHTAHIPAQVGVLPLNLRQWRQSHLTMARTPFLLELLRTESNEYSQPGQQTPSVTLQIQNTESLQERRMILEAHLQHLLAGVLHLPSQHISASTPLKTLGLDSLMALEFRNALEESLKLRLSATIAWSYPTIHNITEYLANMMQVQLDTPALAEEGQKNDRVADSIDITTLEELSDDEIERSLIEQLERRGY